MPTLRLSPDLTIDYDIDYEPDNLAVIADNDGESVTFFASELRALCDALPAIIAAMEGGPQPDTTVAVKAAQ